MSGGFALLDDNEPSAFDVAGQGGGSPFFLICDHAGRRLPRTLGTLGLSDAELGRHIAWDIGAGGLARLLAATLDAPVIRQTYSRLAIDCNRALDARDSIATVSEQTVIPGNRDVTPAEARARADAIFRPYHAAITRALDQRQQAGQPTILVAVHSFTPVFLGQGRAWHAGVLYNRDARLAHPLLRLLRAEGDLIVGDNQPYAVTDTSDFSVNHHGQGRGLPHVELEIRQDLITDEAGQRAWAERLARFLPAAAASAGLLPHG